jgi:hypothetical protein
LHFRQYTSQNYKFHEDKPSNISNNTLTLKDSLKVIRSCKSKKVRQYSDHICCAFMCLYILSSVLWCLLRFPHKNDVRFSLPPVVSGTAHVVFALYVCLHIAVYNTYSVVFFFEWRTLCCQFLWIAPHFFLLPLRYSPTFIYYLKNTTQKTKEEFEDTKGVIRICISRRTEN